MIEGALGVGDAKHGGRQRTDTIPSLLAPWSVISNVDIAENKTTANTPPVKIKPAPLENREEKAKPPTFWIFGQISLVEVVLDNHREDLLTIEGLLIETWSLNKFIYFGVQGLERHIHALLQITPSLFSFLGVLGLHTIGFLLRLTTFI